MIKHLRKKYNETYTPERYKKIIDFVGKKYGHYAPFRIAETPVFIDKDLREKLFEACHQISDVICAPDFKEKSAGAMLPQNVVPGEDDHTTFLQMDFGICRDENGALIPQLIEAQGFPSLYFFQHLVAEAFQSCYDIPSNYTPRFGGVSNEEYMETLRRIIVGDSDPKNVVLLEVEPEKQVTYIDFLIAHKELGIQVKCVSEIKVEGKDLFYLDDNGKKIKIEKIFNRVIFDELMKRDDLHREFHFSKEANVEWIGHPNWFFRISKHTLPLLDNKYTPKSYFLSDLNEVPHDLENYVLKPLYSFAGSGVIINLNRYDLDAIKDRENYILQRKVTYAPVIDSPTGPTKCEIRMLMLWEKDKPRPVIVNNLARLSKGEMIGVSYNKDKEWVGGSVGFFEKD